MSYEDRFPFEPKRNLTCIINANVYMNQFSISKMYIYSTKRQLQHGCRASI